ncbi:RC-LH1 core complex protein PufX [Tabrizicola sp. J26]|uniref:RC-LH1 core complex protein PufX n=1 Tax=Alitabrizicola rongguiensis TaxID=2909234 RepID=UPI001F1E2F6E|nr:RC-LH1 core complex protein PufX [Tabrizicola rongguiensis]MCF1710679.1 RC-LH1 core complex protein PufX [Tabrizicola rongguiensis]
MADEHLYEGQSHVIRLRIWALGQMVWGAFMAGVWLAVVAAFLLVLWVVSQLLPEQSKQAPSPYGALEMVQTTEIA